MSANLENSFHSSSKEGQSQRILNYHTTAFISHTSKVMLKILQAMLRQYANQEISDLQAELQRGRGTNDQIANIL